MGEDAVPDKKQNSAVWRRASARARARKGRALLIPIASTALLPAAFTFVVTIRYPNVARARARFRSPRCKLAAREKGTSDGGECAAGIYRVI